MILNTKLPKESRACSSNSIFFRKSSFTFPESRRPQKLLSKHKSRYDCASEVCVSGRVFEPEKTRSAEGLEERRRRPAWIWAINAGVSPDWNDARNHSFSDVPLVGPWR